MAGELPAAAEVLRHLAAAYRRQDAVVKAYRAQVQADLDWLAERPDEPSRARQPVYRGWFLTAADTPFVVDET